MNNDYIRNMKKQTVNFKSRIKKIKLDTEIVFRRKR